MLPQMDVIASIVVHVSLAGLSYTTLAKLNLILAVDTRTT